MTMRVRRKGNGKWISILEMDEKKLKRVRVLINQERGEENGGIWIV